MYIRTRAYRRKQEAKHYKRRLKIYLSKLNYSDKKVICYYGTSKKLYTVHSWRDLKNLNLDTVKRLRHHYFNDSDKWGKHYTHKIRRRLYKNIDIDVIPQRIHWIRQWEATLHNIMKCNSTHIKRLRKLHRRKEVFKHIYGQELINEYLEAIKTGKEFGLYMGNFSLDDYIKIKIKYNL